MKYIILIILSLTIYSCTILLIRNNSAPIDVKIETQYKTKIDMDSVDVLSDIKFKKNTDTVKKNRRK